jgi:hypothetical protein
MIIMKNNLKKTALAFAVAAISIAPALIAIGQTYPTPVNPPSATGPVTTVTSAFTLINQIVTWVAWIFWIAAILFVLFAAFTYLTAAGDPEKIKTANHRLIYALIAMVIGALAYALPGIVNSFLNKT